MSERPIKLVLSVLFAGTVAILALGAGAISAAPLADPIPEYISQIDDPNLVAVATDLVTPYGPRREDTSNLWC
jgi:hypothetical protein